MLSENEILAYFSKFVEKEIGMVFKEDQFFQLKNRLNSVCSSFRYENFEHLYHEAKKGLSPEVKVALLDIATNNETSFFRDKKVFNLIAKDIISDLVEKRPTLNAWSVASSSGQEAYSLVMLFEQWQKKKGKIFRYTVDGTDICSEILKRAKEAKYSQLEVQRGLPTSFLVEFFGKSQDEMRPWQFNEHLQKNVFFSELNLVDPFRMKKVYDLILCRNVLIYQSPERKAQILERVVSFLRPGGYLVMGSGEMVHGQSENFETVIKDGAIVFKKKEAAAVRAVA